MAYGNNGNQQGGQRDPKPGEFTLSPNKRKQKDTQPDLTGTIWVETPSGLRKHYLSAWWKQDRNGGPDWLAGSIGSEVQANQNQGNRGGNRGQQNYAAPHGQGQGFQGGYQGGGQSGYHQRPQNNGAWGGHNAPQQNGGGWNGQGGQGGHGGPPQNGRGWNNQGGHQNGAGQYVQNGGVRQPQPGQGGFNQTLNDEIPF